MNLEEFIEGFEANDNVELLELTEMDQIHLYTATQMFQRDPLFKDMVGLLLRINSKISYTKDEDTAIDLLAYLLNLHDKLFKEAQDANRR